MARLRRLLALLAVAATPATALTPNPVASRRWRARRTSTESGPEEPFGLDVCIEVDGAAAAGEPPLASKGGARGGGAQEGAPRPPAASQLGGIVARAAKRAVGAALVVARQLPLAVLLFAATPVMGNELPAGVFADKASLKAALGEYNADETNAEATHGPLAGWDVSRIDDMESLFHYSTLNGENGDVSKWDTARVTTFKRTVSAPPRRRQPVVRRATRPPLAARPSAANPPSPPQWEEARSFNADVSKWDTARATDFVNMVRATPRRGAASVPSPAARSAPRRASPPLTASRRPPDCSSG